VVMTLMLLIPCLAWTAEVISGYMVEFRGASLVIKQKGGGKRTIRVDDKTALRFSHKDMVTAGLGDVPKNSKLYVTVEGDLATLVTIEEVPK
jgi:hypothetical protein